MGLHFKDFSSKPLEAKESKKFRQFFSSNVLEEIGGNVIDNW